LDVKAVKILKYLDNRHIAFVFNTHQSIIKITA